MDATYRALAEAYAQRANPEGLRFALRRWSSHEPVPAAELERLHRVFERAKPASLEAELEYAALEGQPVAFATALKSYRRLTGSVPEGSDELERVCYEHAVHLFYVDQVHEIIGPDGFRSIDIPEPMAVQRKLLFGWLAITPKQARRLDERADSIAAAWLASVEEPGFSRLSLDTYLDDHAIVEAPIERKS